jgi:hypothetical protein
MGFVRNPVSGRAGSGTAAAAVATRARGPRSLGADQADAPPSTNVGPSLGPPPPKISTVNMGLAVGWSAVVLSFGKKGWRKSLPHSLGG